MGTKLIDARKDITPASIQCLEERGIKLTKAAWQFSAIYLQGRLRIVHQNIQIVSVEDNTETEKLTTAASETGGAERIRASPNA